MHRLNTLIIASFLICFLQAQPPKSIHQNQSVKPPKPITVALSETFEEHLQQSREPKYWRIERAPKDFTRIGYKKSKLEKIISLCHFHIGSGNAYKNHPVINGQGDIPGFDVSYKYSRYGKDLTLYNVPLELWSKNGSVTKLDGSVTLSVYFTNNNTIGVNHLAASTKKSFLPGVTPKPDAQPSNNLQEPSNNLSLHRIVEAQKSRQPDGQCSAASSARSSVSEASTVASQSDLLPEKKLLFDKIQAEAELKFLDEVRAEWEA